jgi:signal transduction histidine kinase
MAPPLNQRKTLPGRTDNHTEREALAKFRGVSAEWFWESDRDHRIAWVSADFEKRTGLSAADFVGSRPAFLSEEAVGQQQVFRDWRYAHPGAHDEPHHFLINGEPVTDTAGHFAGYRGTGRDFLAHLRRAEERLLDAIEAMEDGFILWDASDRVALCNTAFGRMDRESYVALRPGTRFEDIMRERVKAGKIPAAIGREEDYIRQRLAQHRNPSGALVQQLSTGQWVRIVERRTRDGGIVSIRSDITDLKRQQDELRRAKEEAEGASRAKTRFLATMSHELRTPLNAIIGFSELMQGTMFGPLGSPKYTEYAAAINASGRHLLSLIGDILDMSRIEAGRYELHPQSVDLREVADECLFMLQGRASEDGVTLLNEIRRPGPRVTADRLAIKQVLINLLSNSVKFTPRGGRIICRDGTDGEGRLTISVNDTGVGVSPERLPHLFEPFAGPADASLAKPVGGTGLGLSICRRLMRLHGGDVEIDSELGRGTTATVTFPVKPQVVPASRSPR